MLTVYNRKKRALLLTNMFDETGKFIKFDDESVTSAIVENGIIELKDYAFQDCKYLKTITLPVSLVSIGKGAF